MAAFDFGTDEYISLKNKNASSALLALLLEHHGAPPETAVEEEVLLEPAVEPEPPHASAGPRSAFQKWIDSFEPIPNVNKYPTVHAIKKCVSEQFDVPVHDLESARKTKKIAFARQVAMYLIKELTPRSFPDIGRKFGNRDHSTALYACHKISQMVAADQELAGIISMLTAKVSI